MQNIQFVSASMTISLNDNLTNTKTMSHLEKKKRNRKCTSASVRLLGFAATDALKSVYTFTSSPLCNPTSKSGARRM